MSKKQQITTDPLAEFHDVEARTGISKMDVRRRWAKNDLPLETLLRGEHLQIATLHFEANEPGLLHDSPNEQLYLVMKGEGILEVGEEEIELEKGDGFIVPCGRSHRIRASDDEDLKLLLIAARFHDLLPIPLSAV